MLSIKAIAPSGKINKEKFNSGLLHLNQLIDAEIQYSDQVFQTFRGMAGNESNREHGEGDDESEGRGWGSRSGGDRR